MVAEGVRSQIVVPVFVSGEWWGLLGFDDFESERVWPQAEVEGMNDAYSSTWPISSQLDGSSSRSALPRAARRARIEASVSLSPT